MVWKCGLSFETDYGVGECRRDQRRLQARTLPVNCARVRDKAVGMYRLVYVDVYGEAEGVGRNILFGVEAWVENASYGLKPTMARASAGATSAGCKHVPCQSTV